MKSHKTVAAIALPIGHWKLEDANLLLTTVVSNGAAASDLLMAGLGVVVVQPRY